MSNNTVSALIAASVALIAVYLTQFLAESYRRFKDGSSIAAGIAGELLSYSEALPLIRTGLRTSIEVTQLGLKNKITYRSFEKPVDRFFDEVVGEIGVLGPALAEQVIYVYSNLNAFRAALCLISDKHQEMEAPELIARLTLCSDALERAFKVGGPLTDALKKRSTQKFVPFLD